MAISSTVPLVAVVSIQSQLFAGTVASLNVASVPVVVFVTAALVVPALPAAVRSVLCITWYVTLGVVPLTTDLTCVSVTALLTKQTVMSSAFVGLSIVIPFVTRLLFVASEPSWEFSDVSGCTSHPGTVTRDRGATR